MLDEISEENADLVRQNEYLKESLYKLQQNFYKAKNKENLFKSILYGEDKIEGGRGNNSKNYRDRVNEADDDNLDDMVPLSYDLLLERYRTQNQKIAQAAWGDDARRKMDKNL